MKHFLFFLFFSIFLYSQNNDNISSSIELFCGDVINSTTSNFNSDEEYLESVGLGDCGTSVDSSAGVWYFFNSQSEENIEISMCESSYDTKVHVFRDDGFNLTCVDGNDDSDCDNYLHSKLNFSTEIGYNYYIYISGFNANEGDFTFTFICLGCADEEACNYDPSSTNNDGCTYSDDYVDCDGNCYNDENENGICDEYDIYGCTDDSTPNFNSDATFDNGSCIYDMNCSINEIQVDILLSSDNYPWETSFILNDNQGVVWASENEFQELYTDYLFQYCLSAEGCYIFTVYDSYGDGIFDSGGLQVFYENELVMFNPEFSSEAFTTMNCPPGYDCNTAIEVGLGNHQTETNDYWYVFSPDQNGQYEINTCESDCNTVIYVYNYCTGLLATESNDATIYYNDDECGLQSQVNPLLEEGSIYYLRLVADCDNIDWEISYIGPVQGCMDTAACNFNPIAEIDDGSCLYPGDPDCTSGPDLAVLPFEDSMYLEVYENNDGCAIDEGCLNGYGTRYLVRFDTWIKNIGDQDYFIGSVEDNEDTNQFEWDECHNHWHYKGYAEYVLFDSQGQLIPVGFKNGFCVMDLECSDGGTAQYGCSTMGISAGCGDIYGASLGCQWIDITTVPDGEYTMVVRTNWDQDPDAIGNVELTYENNWMQTCIRVITLEDGSRSYVLATDLDADGIENINDPDVDGDGIMNNDDDDIDGDLISNEFDENPYGLSECLSYTDCNGEEFGNAQLDCNGVCGGESTTGDLNMDGFIDVYDGQEYINQILNDDINATTCNDLDSDNEITVSDIGLLVNCINNESNFRDNQSEPCQYGMEITNPNNTVYFDISEVNWEESYFDISVLNPDNEVLGYQFIVGNENIVINDVENLIPDFISEPDFSPIDRMIIGISLEDSLIQKNYDPTPLCRVYFELPLGYDNSVENLFCIEEIIDVVNQDYENVVFINNSEECDLFEQFDIVEYEGLNNLILYPNPTNSLLFMNISFEKKQEITISVFDVVGNMISSKNYFEKNIYDNIDFSNLSKGIYNVSINYSKGIINKKIIIKK